MVSANSMGTRSSLDLMLDEIQKVNDQPTDNNIPPALPVRPISRARLPRATKPLNLDFQKRISEENVPNIKRDHIECKQTRNNKDIVDRFQTRRELQERSKVVAEEGIYNIQKYYRGHIVRCYYKELRRGVIELQSFIRGENTRRGYNSEDSKSRESKTGERRDVGLVAAYTKVPYKLLVDLQKRVVRTEAKVRGKTEANIALEIQIEEFEKKRQQYEEIMKCKEKAWQDQFTYIQEYLAAAAKSNQASEISTLNERSADYKKDLKYKRELLVCGEESDPSDGVGVEKISEELHPRDELRKLKIRFKEWEKGYECKLRDAYSIFKKLGNSETGKNKNKWWGRLSN